MYESEDFLELDMQQSGGDYPPYSYTGEPEKPKKRRGGAGKFFLGLFLGICLTLCGITVGTKIYHKTTGKLLVLGGSDENTSVISSALLNQLTVTEIEELEAYINAYYTGEYTVEDLQNGLMHGLVSSLGDPYSEYYTAEEYADWQVSTTGSYAGIGAGLSQDQTTMEVMVTKVYANTPAEEAGLLNGDIIVSVGDVDSTSRELSDLVTLIRGDEGTAVHLTIYRPDSKETFEVDVVRRYIDLPSIEYNMLANDIGYIQVSQFQQETASQFQAAIDDLTAQGMKSMIVDLRDNPGGMLSTVVDMLDIILPEGVVVYTEDKYGKRTDYTSDADCLNIPMVVLVNGNSASASEIFAGAIKDYKYGTLIGTTTYGKGIVQSIFPLSNGRGLKITTANYFTPNGNFIHKVGIEPDEVLEYEFLGGEDDTYSQEFDNQLIYAQEYLSK